MTSKNLVSIIAAMTVLCSAAVIAIATMQNGTEEIGVHAVRFVLTCLLAWSLVRGWNPGRWIAVVLLGLGAIGSLIGGLGLMAQTAAGLWMVLLGLIYAACVVGLLSPQANVHFMRIKVGGRE